MLRIRPVLARTATACASDSRPLSSRAKNLTSPSGGVHGNVTTAHKSWRNKPLFRRDGDMRFRTGNEASQMLIEESIRRDQYKPEFLQNFAGVMESLAPVFNRMPRHAFVAKQLLEPERTVQFRVAWLDDSGVIRNNRGWRVQFSSSLGPFEGGLFFGRNINGSVLKSIAFDKVFTNAFAGNLGAGAGGSDFDPHNKSEWEIQRFCQSFMTELSKYIGPDIDLPGMGTGVGLPEIGYLYGQYNRINPHCSQKGQGLLWGGFMQHPQAFGWSIALMAKRMLEDKGETLEGKRCLITGSGGNALYLAEKLLEFGAVPLSFSDATGCIYEPDGLSAQKLGEIMSIKAERAAPIGRFLVSSTTAKIIPPDESLYSTVPCDLAFPCSEANEIDAERATSLADNGCLTMVEGTHMPCTPEALKILRRRGVMCMPAKATLAGASVVNGAALLSNAIRSTQELHDAIDSEVAKVLDETKRTSKEYNTRNDLNAGANIASFMRVANVMLAHGAV